MDDGSVDEGLIRKSAQRFSERSCSNNNLERDDDSSRSHRALETDLMFD
jgi:hypothetical protein